MSPTVRTALAALVAVVLIVFCGAIVRNMWRRYLYENDISASAWWRRTRKRYLGRR